MTVLEFARFYVHYMGWSVIPLKIDKKPAMYSWKHYQTHLPTDKELFVWFGGHSAHNIGIVCGQVSGGLVVVDLDTPEAVMWSIDNNLPETLRVETGKGTHLYYHSNTPVSNFQKRPDLPGVDLRGDGGYVMAPPSKHSSGKIYEWSEFCCNVDELPELPGIVLCAPLFKSSDNQPIFKANQPIINGNLTAHSGVEKRDIIEIAMEGAPVGERNQALASLCGSWLANDVADTFADLVNFALAWNTELDSPMESNEVFRTCKSIWEKHTGSKVKSAPQVSISPPLYDINNSKEVNPVISEPILDINAQPGHDVDTPPVASSSTPPVASSPNTAIQDILNKMTAARLAKQQAEDSKHAPPDLWFPNVDNWLYDEPPPVNFIFKDVLLRNTVGYIHALGGVGKSFMFNSIMLSLVSGSELWEVFKPTQAFRVMMFTAEDNVEIIRRRLWHMSYNFNDTERKTIQTSISDNLLLIPGQPLPLFDMHDSNPILSRGFDSLREVMGYYKPDVLMLDPKSMFYGSLAENDNSHNTYFVSALKQFVTPEFDSTVLFTHHESKAAGGLGQQQSSRGGQALSDGVRWQVSMSRLTEDDAKKINKLDDINNFVKVEQTKSNYTKFFSPFYLVRDDYGCLDVFDMYQEKNKAGISVIIEALKTNTCKLWELKYAAGKPFIKKCKEIGGKGFGRDEITRVIESGLDSGILRKTNNDYIEVI